jgi:ribosomal protein L22
MWPRLKLHYFNTCATRRFPTQATTHWHRQEQFRNLCFRSLSQFNKVTKSKMCSYSQFVNTYYTCCLLKEKTKEPTTSTDLFSEAIEEVGKTTHLKEKEEKLDKKEKKAVPPTKLPESAVLAAKPVPTQAIARRKNIPISWKKLTVLCRLIRGCTVKEALRRLTACPRPAAAIVARIVKQAHNNAVALGLGSDFSFPSKTKRLLERRKQRQEKQQSSANVTPTSTPSPLSSATTTTANQLFASLPTVQPQKSDNPLVIAHAITGRSYYLKRLNIHARGRTGILRRPHSHLTIIVQHKKDLPAYKNYLKRKEKWRQRTLDRQRRRNLELQAASVTTPPM